MKKNRILQTLILILCINLAACHKPEAANVIRVGTIAGPETQLMQAAKKVALQRFGLHVKIVTFNDYIQPNSALVDGDIDANSFQHLPYLEAQNKAHDWHLVAVAKTFLYPMAIYSNKYTRLQKLPHGGKIALPNDPSNETRALLLLQQQHVITLRHGQTELTPDAITNNPKRLTFETFDAAFLPRTLDDVDAAIINTTYAQPAGLKASQALARENTHSRYTNVIATTQTLAASKKIQELVKAFQSAPVLAKAKSLFGNNAIAGFKLAPENNH